MNQIPDIPLLEKIPTGCQVIDFDELGHASCLMTPGKGLDLRELGPVSIKRISEIQFDQQTQLFFIEWMKDGTYFNIHQLAFCQFDECSVVVRPSGLVLFSSYEKAIEAEVCYIRRMRDEFGPDSI